jgi:hypothetical protein
MFRSRQFELGDELCESGAYWFAVSDIEEVRHHFGESAVLERLPGLGDDWTVTDVPFLERTAETRVEEAETSVLLLRSLVVLLVLLLVVLLLVKVSVARY